MSTTFQNYICSPQTMKVLMTHSCILKNMNMMMVQTDITKMLHFPLSGIIVRVK